MKFNTIFHQLAVALFVLSLGFLSAGNCSAACAKCGAGVCNHSHDGGLHGITYDGELPKSQFSRAFVTTNEAGMDTVFSQTSFGGDDIDIRFLPTMTVIGPEDVTTSAQLNQLFGLATDSSPTVNMFFVDVLDYCGVFNTSIVGCASTPGNILAVESVAAAASFGTELNAHELGHNLGLGHTASSGLMGPAINSQTSLTAGEVATINASALVQGSAPNRFINIRPILIVPEPSSLLLLTLSVLFVGALRGRDR